MCKKSIQNEVKKVNGYHFIQYELNSIELLGHAMNILVDAKHRSPHMALDHIDMVEYAYQILADVRHEMLYWEREGGDENVY